MEGDLLLSLAEAIDDPSQQVSSREHEKTTNKQKRVDVIESEKKKKLGMVGTLPVTNLSKSLVLGDGETNGTSRGLRQPRLTPLVRKGSLHGASHGYSSLSIPSKPLSSFKDLGQGSLIQRHSGLKVKNPLISSSRLESQLSQRAMVRLSQLNSRHNAFGPAASGAWATIAVVGEVSQRRTSSSGKKYVVWKLTDLDDVCVSLFLFGRAYSDLDDEAKPGTMVAVLSPKLRKEDNNLCASIDSGDQVLILGTAADFGYCKSRRRDGQPCTVPVNTARCPYCSYHVNSEYKRLQSKRLELGGGNLKTAFRSKANNTMKWKSGEFSSAENPSKSEANRPISREAMRSVALKAAQNGSTSGARYLGTLANPDKIRAAAAQAELEKKSLKGKAHAHIPLGRVSAVVCQADSVGYKQITYNTKKHENFHRIHDKSNSRHRQISILKDHNASPNNGEINLDCDEDAPEPLLNELDMEVRQRAVEILKSSNKHIIESGLQSEKKIRKLPQFLAEPLKKKQKLDGAVQLPTETEYSSEKEIAAQTRSHLLHKNKDDGVKTSFHHNNSSKASNSRYSRPVTSTQNDFAAAFGSVIQEMEERHAAGRVQSGTLYKQAVEDDKDAEIDLMIDSLEKKDEIAQKMDSIKKLKVTGWKCNACNSIASHRRQSCLQEHPNALEKVQVTKRWWICKHCHRRFETLGIRYPTGRCPKCNTQGVDFEQVSMFRPQKEAPIEVQEQSVASKSGLLARGLERKWVQS